MAAAQCNLGVLYRGGPRRKQDDRKAAALFRASAGQGFARGQFLLGLHWRTAGASTGMKKQAAQEYRRAAGKLSQRNGGAGPVL